MIERRRRDSPRRGVGTANRGVQRFLRQRRRTSPWSIWYLVAHYKFFECLVMAPPPATC